jgi:uncharacterized protein YbjT (DUF2867 family)
MRRVPSEIGDREAADPVCRPVRRTVLEAGATGRLGGVVDALLGRGHVVRAMTRDVDSPAADRLRLMGAELVYGDFDEAASIEAAALGAEAIFATGTAHRAGPEGEVRHGQNLAEAAAHVEVPHLVYSSGDGAAQDSPLPLFRAKFRVEERIRSLGIPHTILAPVYFMENLFNPWNLAALRRGRLPSPVPLHVPLQQTAVADLIGLATLAIERPAEFTGQRVGVASDELTAERAAAAVSGVVGKELYAEQLSVEDLEPPLRALFAWLERVGHHVDTEDLRRRYPEVGWHRYADWADSQRVRFSELCPDGSPVAA